MALFKLVKRVKPIFVVGFPSSLKTEAINRQFHALQKELKGYYVIAYKDNTLVSVKFECFNCELNEIEYHELKDKLFKTIKQ
jgi:hypothetical protein